MASEEPFLLQVPRHQDVGKWCPDSQGGAEEVDSHALKLFDLTFLPCNGRVLLHARLD